MRVTECIDCVSRRGMSEIRCVLWPFLSPSPSGDRCSLRAQPRCSRSSPSLFEGFSRISKVAIPCSYASPIVIILFHCFLPSFARMLSLSSHLLLFLESFWSLRFIISCTFLLPLLCLGECQCFCLAYLTVLKHGSDRYSHVD
ncbi:hypothetical protein BDV09DRAFT_167336 [Aspergillus tetrazonus]